jgi:hypothetical protein
MTDTDQIADAVIEVSAVGPDATVSGDFLAADDLEAWRSTAQVGETVVYYVGPGLMRSRTKDVALDRTAAVAYSLYLSGRGTCVQAKIGDGVYQYQLQAMDGVPIKPRM